LKLVSGSFSPLVAKWVGEQIGRDIEWGPCEAIGVTDTDDNLIGGVVFSNYQPHFGNIEVSFASNRRDWLTPCLIQGILRYPFDQLKVNRITCATPKRNRRARQFLKKFGFVEEGNVRGGFGNDDMIVSGLLASEWQEHRFNRGTSSDAHSKGR
jgi:RimJ/RimL family protein N-acetyltransferase